LTLLFQAQVAVAAADAPLTPGTLTVQLESDKPSYQAREPVKIRIAIQNNSAEDYSLNAVPPWALCSLEILDSDNKPLVSSGLQFGYRITTAGLTYRSHSTQAVGFNDPYAILPNIVYWAPVSIWGYSLSKPGTYTITATAKFTATAMGTRPYQQFTLTEKSNSIRITVSP
jgi:hypothetical protein